MPDAAPLLSAALALAAEGLPVFLLGRTKRPVANCRDCPADDPDHDRVGCGHLTCHGFYAATTDPDRIRAMHEIVRGGLLALRTGAASGLAVIDIDPRNGGRLIPELMPPTRCVATGSGGWHLYYRNPGGPLATNLDHRGYPGIDVKAEGGYVVAPPSIHPGTRRPYRLVGDRSVIEMSPPLIAACRPAEAPPATPSRPFRVLLTGSRTWTDVAAITAVLDRLHARHGAALVVVHGACPRGADAIADQWCRDRAVSTEQHPADWSTGRQGGPARNAAMVATRPDLCLAFIRDRSPGASGCARLADQAGITTVRNPSPAELPPAVSRPAAPTPTSSGGLISDPAALLAAHLRAVDRAPTGRRRVTLYGAARGVARMVAAGAISAVDAWAALYAAGQRAEQSHYNITTAITGGFRAEAVPIEGVAA
ncbi:bifunctional DNA primase/polymerase [Actinoplanes sp. HUAS TT8]|uniref:bifunctional DNA primase/polymerase n=1 Tax=Actinoplanes sp. HUAS TT8 TaxID=3447453 RepID=UPI003F51FA80